MRRSRLAANKTQKELGLQVATVSRVERCGDDRRFFRPPLLAVCDALGLEPRITLHKKEQP